MSNSIVIAVVVVAVIGIIAGAGLSIASALMAVPKDERAEKVLEHLPGANCGACGYSGCAGYAAAVASGEAQNGLCVPGGTEAANKISRALGLAKADVKRKVAIVHCLGTYDNTSDKIEYQGVNSCAAAMQLYGGVASCQFGCVGLGDCARACPYNAIMVCNGVSTVDGSICKGCGICVATCPKGIISLVEPGHACVLCSSRVKGGETRKVCKAGCLGCMKCTKVCESGAITVTDFCASVDYDKCTKCGKCVETCPAHIVHIEK